MVNKVCCSNYCRLESLLFQWCWTGTADGQVRAGTAADQVNQWVVVVVVVTSVPILPLLVPSLASPNPLESLPTAENLQG